jgi:DNA-binding transcriptional regulator PaaX
VECGGTAGLRDIKDAVDHPDITESAVRTTLYRMLKEGWVIRDSKTRQWSTTPKGEAEFNQE